MVWTNIGKEKMFEIAFEGSSAPSYFALQLATSAGSWSADLSSTSQITLVTPGNGYTASGLKVNRDGVDLVVSANYTFDYARATLKSGYEWSATGGTIADVSYVLLTAASDGDDPDARTIWAYWNLGTEYDIPSGSRLVINSGSLQGT